MKRSISLSITTRLRLRHLFCVACMIAQPLPLAAKSTSPNRKRRKNKIVKIATWVTPPALLLMLWWALSPAEASEKSNDNKRLFGAQREDSFPQEPFAETSESPPEASPAEQQPPPITTALHQAAGLGNLQNLEHALSEGKDVNDQDQNGHTPLMKAVINDEIKFAKELMPPLINFSKRHYADLNKIDNRERDAFMLACLHGSYDIVKWWCGLWRWRRRWKPLSVRNPEKQDYRDSEGCNALMLAAKAPSGLGVDPKKKLKIIKALLKLKFNLDARDHNGMTLFMIAIHSGYDGIANYLLKERAIKKKLNSRTDYGDTALTMAILGGNQRMVKKLVKTGARCDLVNREGKSALSIAIACNNEEIVEFLLKQKSVLHHINDPDFEGNTPLATAHNLKLKHQATIKRLTSNDPDSQGGILLTIAQNLQQSNKVIIALLTKAGANTQPTASAMPQFQVKEVNPKILPPTEPQEATAPWRDMRDKMGRNSFMIAARTGQTNTAHQILAQCPARLLSFRDNKSKNVLMMAIQQKKPNVTGYLLSKRIIIDSINDQDAQGRTAAMFAAEKCTKMIEPGSSINEEKAPLAIARLYDLGADLNIRDNKGRSAEDYATSKQVKAFFKRLKTGVSQ